MSADAATSTASKQACRVLAVIGDANDPGAWSGIPYHFLQAARARGVIQRGLDLQPRGPVWRLNRLLWNGFRLLGGDRAGGYQFSAAFLDRLWTPHLAAIQGLEVVNHFQLCAPSVVSLAAEGRLSLVPYIDMTAYGGQGSICSSVVDLLRWSRALNTGGVVSLDSLDRMRSPATVTGTPSNES